jgi:hypothetical protein
MIGETDLFGVFMPALLPVLVVALALTALLRRALAATGFYRLVWHRPLFDLALLVIVTGLVAVLASFRTMS